MCVIINQPIKKIKMKTIFRTAVFAALLITASCAKDEANPDQLSQEQSEELESTPLEVNVVSDNVVIKGSTKEEGESPAPNGAISLDVSNTSKSAFLDEGFDVKLSSDGDIVGAYLRFKTEDGNSADSYYDIDIDENSTFGKSSKKVKSRFRNASNLIAKVDEANLDIGFNSTIEPGTFCYELCVYDAEGNISNPEEVCVTVESWGGNSSAVGKWMLTKTYKAATSQDFQALNVEYCEDETVERACSLDSFKVTFDREECEKIEYFEITLNSDGTYTEKFKDIFTTAISNVDIPPGLTMNDLVNLCMYSFEDSETVTTYDGSGKWAYQSDIDNFVFIEYNYEEIYDGESYSESYEPGEGSLYYGAGGDYNGEVKIIDGKLVISNFEFVTAEFEK